MTDSVIIVGYDGTDPAERAVSFAADRAAAEGASLHLVHVLEWSPYSFLTADELAERHKRRNEELIRGEAILEPALKKLTERGLGATSEVRHGHAGELLCKIAAAKGAAQIVVGRKGSSGLEQRILGSLAITLIQAAPVPVTVVP